MKTEADAKRLSKAVELTIDTVAITDRRGTIEYVNNAFETVTGYSKGEVLGRNPRLLKSGTHDRQFYAELWRTLVSGDPFRAEFTNKKKNGELWVHEQTITPLKNAKGEITHFVAIGRDITERKQVEKSLRESEERFANAFNHSPAGMSISSIADGRLVCVNEALLKMTGYSRKEVIGKTPIDFGIWTSQDERKDFFSQLENQEVASGRISGRSKSGDTFAAHLVVIQVTLQGEVHYLSTLHDVTRLEKIDQAFRESEFWLRESQRVGRLGSFVYDIEKDWWTSSEEMDRIFGVVKDQDRTIAGCLKLTHPDDRDMIADLYMGFARSGRVPDGDPRRDGFDADHRLAVGIEEERWVHARGELIVDDQGFAVKVIGTVLDITERKNAERALQISEERFKTLFEFAPDAYFLMDTNGTLVDGNENTEILTGYNRLELLGRNFISAGFIDPADVSRASESFLRRLRGEPIDYHEYTVRRKSGEKVHVDLRTVRLNVAGKDTVLAIARDITERKEMENALKESERFSESIVENIPHMIFVKDADDLRFVRLNRAAESIIGIPRTELLGRNDYDFFPQHEADFFVQKDRQALESTDPVDIPEETLETAAGKKVLHTKKISLQGPDGKPRYLLGISEDITERKEMEERQESLEAQLLRAQRLESLGTLAGGIAHDLNNVLAPIRLSIDLLREKLEDPFLLKILQTVEKSSVRGAELIRQVLAFAKGKPGEQVLVNVKHVLKEIIDVLKETFPKSIRVQTEIDRDLRLMIGDPTQLHQVLMNLSVNARDAMPNGGTLGISARNVTLERNSSRGFPAASPGDYVLFIVRDSGTGMTQEVRERIFDPFFTTKESNGTGLGLSTVHTIVKKHGGFLDVSSEPGKGSEFRVIFPAVEFEGVEVKPITYEMRRGGGEVILVIDDEVAIRQMTKDALETFGYSVLLAGDGKEALSIYEAESDRIAMVITDIAMPGMDGVATIRALQRINPGVKILAVSGIEEALQVPPGVRKLAKPYSMGMLLELIQESLGAR